MQVYQEEHLRSKEGQWDLGQKFDGHLGGMPLLIEDIDIHYLIQSEKLNVYI